MSKHIVALTQCPDYRLEAVEAALATACNLAGFPELNGKTVLLKPNILNASDPERCATTHPIVLQAAIRYLKGRGAGRILVGDSPGWQAQDMAGSKTGLLQASEAEGAHWCDFSQDQAYEVAEGRLVRRFQLTRALAQADFVVSLPKLKTHGLMYFTGAVKNLFGLIPGFQKSAFHMRFPDRTDFAVMLNDLSLAAKADFAIMDGIIGMQGQGPNSGTPCPVGAVLASPSLHALDWVAADLIGYDPADIPYLALARDDRRYGFDPAAIELAGTDPNTVRPRHFELVKVLHENDIIRAHVPQWLHVVLKNLLVPRPVFKEKACIHCAACVKICPAKALAFVDGKKTPDINYQTCIRCYCCDEVCPVKAIDLKKFLIGRSRR